MEEGNPLSYKSDIETTTLQISDWRRPPPQFVPINWKVKFSVPITSKFQQLKFAMTNMLTNRMVLQMFFENLTLPCVQKYK